MNILLINQDWFAQEWRAAGHRVEVAGIGDHCPIRVPHPLASWEELCARASGDPFTPDVIIVHDNSSPVIISGLERAPMPVIFYSVDAHHHASYHKYLAGAFDLTFVAQRDYMQPFIDAGEPVEWLPLWASRFVEASAEKRYGAVFVGTLDKKLNPDRVTFFEALQKIHPVTIERGEYWKIFPFADVVINQTVKGDLNFRVFEAMMCGACLLTESGGNGLEDIFTPGQHLMTYNRGNAAEAAQVIEQLLAQPEQTRKIADQGRAEILAKHLPSHRADTMMKAIEALGGKRRARQRPLAGMAANYAVLSVSVERVDPGMAREIVREALRLFEASSAVKEPVTLDLMCHAILCSLRYDRWSQSRAGIQFIERLRAIYPEQHVLTLALIRDRLNSGDEPGARAFSDQLGITDYPYIFKQSETIMQDLLAKVSVS